MPSLRVEARRTTPRRPAVVAVRYLLAVVLLATGLGKLLDVAGFAGIVDSYGVLPQILLLPAATALTVAELGLGAWLASGRRQRVAALVSALLHGGYAVWSGVALWRGLALINCGCFGVFFARPLGPGTVIEDGLLGALSLFAMHGARR